MTRGSEAGVTLVEMLVALALFALIGLVGFGVLNTILRAEERTEGRIQHLERIDSTLRLLARDLETGAPETLRLSGAAFAIAATGAETGTRLDWRLSDGTLIRRFRRSDAEPVDQAVLEQIAGWRLRVLARGGAWAASWPPTAGQAAPEGVEVTLILQQGVGEAREVTRLFVLAEVPPPPPRPVGLPGLAGAPEAEPPDPEQDP